MAVQETLRQKVWEQLRGVAHPDSRFDFDFASFIPDFDGSAQATELLVSQEAYRQAQFGFVTPDNCLEELRRLMLQQNKLLLVTTYGIRRGFVMVTQSAALGNETLAASLDGMERFGAQVTLRQIQEIGRPLDFLVTGASVVTTQGLRMGKGHGYFDLEWAMLRDIGVVTEATPVIALVHDCQVVDSDLQPSPHDTVADLIVTPTRVIEVPKVHPKPGGINWAVLPAHYLDEIPPLRELRDMQAAP